MVSSQESTQLGREPAPPTSSIQPQKAVPRDGFFCFRQVGLTHLMRGSAKNSVLKLLRSALGLTSRSGYTSLVLSTGEVRTDAELSGFRTEGERSPRIKWV